MDESKIKDAFAKVKHDMDELKEQLALFTQELLELKNSIFAENIYKTSTSANQQTDQHISTENPAIQHINSSTSTDKLALYSLKTPNIDISTGNKGVPADRQTDRQTDQHTGNKGVSSFQEIPEILETINTIKEEVRVKFKRLTKQEITVFSIIYSLEEQGFIVDYTLLSQKLSLTESSIRDYIQRLIKKGLPLQKTKENNKKIFISISPDFKKIVSLSTLHKLNKI